MFMKFSVKTRVRLVDFKKYSNCLSEFENKKNLFFFMMIEIFFDLKENPLPSIRSMKVKEQLNISIVLFL